MSQVTSFFTRHRSRVSTIWVVALFVAAGGLALTNLGPGDGPAAGRLVSDSDRHGHGQIDETFKNLPLSFEENRGQTDQEVRYFSRNSSCTLYLTRSEAIVQFRQSSGASGGTPKALKLKLIGASSQTRLEGLNPLPGKSNYFIGNDPRDWRTDIPNFSRLRYREAYPGIDLVYYGTQKQLEYDFVLAPHADPKQIKLVFEGARETKIDDQGDLRLSLGEDQLLMRKPVIYQEEHGERREIAGSFAINGRGELGFEIGGYDPSRKLIIDPVMDFSTFYGGSGTDIGYGIAVDQPGNIYITGQTWSPNFPTKRPYSSMLGGANDAFVMKLNPTGTEVIFATYLGGRNPGDRGWGITVDNSGNVYFAGETGSINFPVVNAAQPSFRGTSDAFVAKLNNNGNTLLYSTYLGGFFYDTAYAIAIDRLNNVYVTGHTEAANFPIKNALQPRLQGARDAFVTKFNANGGIVFSTYLGGDPTLTGGRDDEAGYGIAVDSQFNIYVAGFTGSPNFPTVNAYQANLGGVIDGFITKINAEGSELIYSTFLGGSGSEKVRGIALDSFGNAYLTGYTTSTDFPRQNAWQPQFQGNADGFVTKLSATGGGLIYSTYLGGSGTENTGLDSEDVPSCAIAVDSQGNAYLTGKTSSTNFPVANPLQNMLLGDNDAYLTKLDPSGTELIYSTYLGSTNAGNLGYDERGLAIAVDNLGNAYLTGQALKNDFPTVAPVQKDYGGGLSDIFIAKISTPDIATVATVSAASFSGAALAPESIVTTFGNNVSNGYQVADTLPLPTTMLGTSVRIKDKTGTERAAPLFFVSPFQINFLIPTETEPGKAQITVTNSQPAPPIKLSANIWIERVAPALFTANANGQGVPSAFVLRVKSDGAQIYEPVAIQDFFGQFIPLPIDFGTESDQIYLILFGSGFRHRSDLSKVSARIAEVDVPVLYAGAQGSYVGQDQVNLQLPRSLAGRGEVSLILTVDGMLSNRVTIKVN